MRHLILIAAVLWSAATPAFAYIGPGLGAGALAVVAGVVGSVFLAIFAVLYYPIKRVLRRRKTLASETDTSPGD